MTVEAVDSPSDAPTTADPATEEQMITAIQTLMSVQLINEFMKEEDSENE